MAGPPLRPQVLQLYRRAVRLAKSFPDASVGRKLQYNARMMIRLRQEEKQEQRLQRLIEQGHRSLDAYESLATNTPLLHSMLRKYSGKV